MPALPSSLRALLGNLIDYAGLYPPAALTLQDAAAKYTQYAASSEAWMLNRLVLPATALSQIELADGWRVTLLVDGDPGELPSQVETLETKVAQKFSLPTYCEVPLKEVGHAYAKVRTGGLTPEAIPSVQSIADFLAYASQRRMPFKATAGLHHALRSMRPLTYAPDSPRAVMHGFLNVFIAAAFAWQGEDELLVEILREEDAGAFQFKPNELRWRDHRLSVPQIQSARDEFAHSFGSCSFEEPVADLRDLGLLP